MGSSGFSRKVLILVPIIPSVFWMSGLNASILSTLDEGVTFCVLAGDIPEGTGAG